MDLNKIKLIDLTHTLTPEVPSWSGHCGFHHQINSDNDDSTTDTKFRTYTVEMQAGIGTHMDAPSHCFMNGKSIADINLEQLFVPCIVIDIPDHAPDDYELTLENITDFERNITKIDKNTFIIVRTGWGTYWNNPKKYRNELNFPTISSEAANLLVERNIVGIGIDTLSPDSPKSDFPVHKTILGAGKYIIENIANAHLLPAYGSIICAMPIKIKDGTEAPIRLVGITTL